MDYAQGHANLTAVHGTGVLILDCFRVEKMFKIEKYRRDLGSS